MAWSFFKHLFFILLITSVIIPNLDKGNDQLIAPRVGHKTSNPINPDRLVLHMVTSNYIFEEAETREIVYSILRKSLEQPQSSDQACKNINPKILIVTVERRIFISDPAMQKITGIARYSKRIQRNEGSNVQISVLQL